MSSKAEANLNASNNSSTVKAPQRQALEASEEEKLLSCLSMCKKRKTTEATDPSFLRLNRKLVLREWRKRNEVAAFDIDLKMIRVLRRDSYSECDTLHATASHSSSPPPSSQQTTQSKVVNSQVLRSEVVRGRDRLNSSFEWNHTSIISPYSKRILRPFIRRDVESIPLKKQLLLEIVSKRHTQMNHDAIINDHYISAPLDYCYLDHKFLNDVNSFLSLHFWPGIDVSESTEWPEHTVICFYKKLVIGCGLMNPDGYITYLLVHPDWRGAGVATFMLYHLIQTLPGKDITLHVSVTNEAVLLYQKFGFKAEEYVKGFYKKYYPDDDERSGNSKNNATLVNCDEDIGITDETTARRSSYRNRVTLGNQSTVIHHRRSTDAFLLRLRA
eukprot:TRINITY_DN12965_c0_g1_i1.p1 TRINITY_DN12965_c0_g1~~TRINITY_DN12965_c0_g1_i1.p1  ORF type:complete len:453 (+),score=62.15 TRINITY_DN12965_c0_g1_i1:202-1359(+)